MDPNDVLDACTGFDWDDGNREKNRALHDVVFWEVEEVFFNSPLVVTSDRTHSRPTELRLRALGTTDAGRALFVSFTVRRHLIRVISVRDTTRRELRAYENSKA